MREHARVLHEEEGLILDIVGNIFLFLLVVDNLRNNFYHSTDFVFS